MNLSLNNIGSITEWADLGQQCLPFADLVSDVYLLATVWPRTKMIAPSDLDMCSGQRILWYMALAFSVIGTLVDLVPEALLLTEIARNWRVVGGWKDARRVLTLLLSDGKPIIRFAANDSWDYPTLTGDSTLSGAHRKMQVSLRRRLGSIAASLYMCDGLKKEPKWTYAGLIALLVGGELLTAAGAAIFLHIEFSGPALVSLLASIFALLLSTRDNMRRVGEETLHVFKTSGPEILKSGRFFEFAIPGPLVFVRFLLLIPVWPLMIIYIQAVIVFYHRSASFTGDDSDLALPWSDDAIWISPVGWSRITAPVFDLDDEKSLAGVSFLSLWIIPHLLTTIVVATWATISVATRAVRWFFGYQEFFVCGGNNNNNNNNNNTTQWGKEFTNPDSEFHRMSSLLQGAFGLAFTSAVSKNAIVLIIVFIISIGLTWLGLEHQGPSCAQQEWLFVFAVTSWWSLMLIVHVARRINVFRPLVALPGPTHHMSLHSVSVRPIWRSKDDL